MNTIEEKAERERYEACHRRDFPSATMARWQNGEYAIESEQDGWRWWLAAKQDAQARGGEAVAWQYLSDHEGWKAVCDEQRDKLKRAGYQIRALGVLSSQPAPALAREPLSEIQALAMNPYIVGDEVKQALWLSAVRMTERHFGITADSARAAAPLTPLYATQPAPALILTPQQREVLMFLWGSGSLQGVGFGTQPKGVKAPFWWRTPLLAAFPELRITADSTRAAASVLPEIKNS